MVHATDRRGMPGSKRTFGKRQAEFAKSRSRSGVGREQKGGTRTPGHWARAVFHYWPESAHQHPLQTARFPYRYPVVEGYRNPRRARVLDDPFLALAAQKFLDEQVDSVVCRWLRIAVRRMMAVGGRAKKGSTTAEVPRRWALTLTRPLQEGMLDVCRTVVSLCTRQRVRPWAAKKRIHVHGFETAPLSSTIAVEPTTAKESLEEGLEDTWLRRVQRYWCRAGAEMEMVKEQAVSRGALYGDHKYVYQPPATEYKALR